jgi:hypothetical protein
MAGIHEIIQVTQQPKRRPKPSGDPRMILSAYVAQFEELARRNRSQLARLESLLQDRQQQQIASPKASRRA